MMARQDQNNRGRGAVEGSVKNLPTPTQQDSCWVEFFAPPKIDRASLALEDRVTDKIIIQLSMKMYPIWFLTSWTKPQIFVQVNVVLHKERFFCDLCHVTLLVLNWWQRDRSNVVFSMINEHISTDGRGICFRGWRHIGVATSKIRNDGHGYMSLFVSTASAASCACGPHL